VRAKSCDADARLWARGHRATDRPSFAGTISTVTTFSVSKPRLGAALQRYFFVIEGDGFDHPDPSGTLLPNLESVRAYAHRIIGELKAAGGYDAPGLAMVVQDASRKALFSIPFEQAEPDGDDSGSQ
jgi:hypothetical protein